MEEKELEGGFMQQGKKRKREREKELFVSDPVSK
jgi:hypothetical protein